MSRPRLASKGTDGIDGADAVRPHDPYPGFPRHAGDAILDGFSLRPGLTETGRLDDNGPDAPFDAALQRADHLVRLDHDERQVRDFRRFRDIRINGGTEDFIRARIDRVDGTGIPETLQVFNNVVAAFTRLSAMHRSQRPAAGGRMVRDSGITVDGPLIPLRDRTICFERVRDLPIITGPPDPVTRTSLHGTVYTVKA